MAYLMKFNRNVPSVVGDEVNASAPNDAAQRYFAKGKTYAIAPNDAVHFHAEGFAAFVKNPKKK